MAQTIVTKGEWASAQNAIRTGGVRALAQRR
jgi:hypothetical protein